MIYADNDDSSTFVLFNRSKELCCQLTKQGICGNAYRKVLNARNVHTTVVCVRMCVKSVCACMSVGICFCVCVSAQDTIIWWARFTYEPNMSTLVIIWPGIAWYLSRRQRQHEICEVCEMKYWHHVQHMRRSFVNMHGKIPGDIARGCINTDSLSWFFRTALQCTWSAKQI